MTPKPLTATMAIALADTFEHGGKLVRWQHSFWTYPGCSALVDGGNRKPDWYVGNGTVDALVTRGQLKFTQYRRRQRTRVAIAAEVA